MPKTNPSLDTIVCAAVEITNAAERSQYLTDACGDDRQLRQRVEELIEAHFGAGRFLAEPTPTTSGDAVDQTGAVIGRYRLLELIGEGGMGLVFVAEQLEPIHRRVALKMIKPGVDSREVLARFAAERQALTLMDHPNIAKVLDAGATTAGHPYFVMDLVRGLPITEYCDQAKLLPVLRLQLFVQVCRAIQHAHQKGIIHRDIKPSNILVTMQDGVPVPKVIDFGVAKAMHQQLGDHSVYTRFTQLIGTPLYMSPEQAELSAVDIDTRSDVYSLGVLLYELLTGQTPFDSNVIQKADFDEMRRMIREVEPPRPSARLSTLDAKSRSTVSAHRSLDDRQLARLLSGDLDWIVMKSLEKDRNRRYESVSAFAADIERYLEHEPVEARPPSKAYRAKKFVRRNRAALTVGTLLLSSILAVAGTIAWTQWNASRRQAMEEQAVADALAEADQFEEQGRWSDARSAVERAAALVGDAKRVDLEDRLRTHTLLRRLDEIQLETTNSLEVARRKRGVLSYGEAFREYGLDLETIEPNEFARRLPNGRVRNEIIGALDDWAILERRHDRNGEGWKRTVAAARASDPDPWSDRLRAIWVAEKPADRATILELGESAPLSSLHPNTIRLMSLMLIKAGEHSTAIKLLKDAIKTRPNNFYLLVTLALAYHESKPPRYEEEVLAYLRVALATRPESANAYTVVGEALSLVRKFDESISMYEQALRLEPDYYVALNGLGATLIFKGDLDRAELVLRQAIQLAPEQHPAYHNLGLARWKAGDFEAAAKYYKEAARLQPKYALAHLYYGNSLIRLKRFDEATKAFEEAIRQDPDNWRVYSGLAGHLAGNMNDIDGAITAYRQAIKRKPDSIAADDVPRIAQLHTILGTLLARKRQFAESVDQFRAALRIDNKNSDAHRGLTPMLLQLGYVDDAIIAAQESVRLYPQNSFYQFHLGQAYLKCQLFENAIGPFRESARLDPTHAESFCNLGYALKKTGKYQEALTAYRRGHELGMKTEGWTYPSANWVKECEALVEAAEKSKPTDPATGKQPVID